MSRPLLRIENVQKIYTSSKKPIHALRGVTLEIQEGEIFALLGVNGAGKTTLSLIIATLHPATSGTVTYKGISIYSDIFKYRTQIGFCPQKPNFESGLTVREHLVFAGKFFGMPQAELNTQIDRLLTIFELKKYANEKVEVLSGGYKQRLLIARALVHKPGLVLLDEPTVALDPHIRRNLWELIKRLKQEGVTILLTTHYLDEAEYLADRLCILEKGSIKLIDTPANLTGNYSKKLEDVFIELMNTEGN